MAKYLPDMRIGDDYNIKLVVADVDASPIDITGYKFYLTLKTAFEDADATAVLQYSTTAGDNINDDVAGGVCYLTVPGATTKLIPQGKYFYDIQQIVNGAIKTVLPPVEDYKDKLIVVPEVTKAIV